MEFSTISTDQNKRIKISGQLTFADNQKFKQIISLLSENGLESIEFDFADTDFIDSAGLGMLLLFRDECIQKHINLSLHSAQGQVEKIFTLSKFDQIFSIHK